MEDLIIKIKEKAYKKVSRTKGNVDKKLAFSKAIIEVLLNEKNESLKVKFGA